MIKEAYVSFEVAKLLKEKGFDEPCLKNYWNSDKELHNWNWTLEFHTNKERNLNTKDCAAPTHQMACDWVRKKGWHISVQLSYDDDYNAVYYITISSTKTFLAEDIGELEDKYFSKVEDANDEALKYLLENLI